MTDVVTVRGNHIHVSIAKLVQTEAGKEALRGIERIRRAQQNQKKTSNAMRGREVQDEVHAEEAPRPVQAQGEVSGMRGQLEGAKRRGGTQT